MTIICVWHDESYGRERISSVADSRSSRRQLDGTYTRLNDSTSKLFRLMVRCHGLDSLDHQTGAWSAPYYTTTIGLGFCGYIEHGLSVTSLFEQALDQLVAVDGGTPKPEPHLVANLLTETCSRFLADHDLPSDLPLEFFVFGHSPTDRKPWLWKVVASPKRGVTQTSLSLGTTDFHCIGDAPDNFEERVEQLRIWFEKHRRDLKPGRGGDSFFELQREGAIHRRGDRKAIDGEILKLFLNGSPNRTVGGVPQRLEVFEVGGTSVVALSQGTDGHILTDLPAVGTGLQYVAVVETLQRTVQQPESITLGD